MSRADLSNRELLSLVQYRNQHCSNCGKHGHVSRICKEPVTSLGAICVKFSDTTMFTRFKDRLWRENGVSIPHFNMLHNVFLPKASEYNDQVRFLLIQRRHSLGFLEFMRGRYEIRDYQGITKLFRLMSQDEINLIQNTEFNNIWSYVWARGTQNFLRLHDEEYVLSKAKFESLRNNYREENILGLSYYTTNVTPDWCTPEWGFPKGRRANFERNYDCAMREFKEETGYDKEDHTVMDSVQPLREVFRGTNNVLYKHLYYLTLLNNNEKPPNVDSDNKEIGNIGWFTYSEALKLIRPYHTEKKRVLTEVFHFIISTLESEKK